MMVGAALCWRFTSSITPPPGCDLSLALALQCPLAAASPQHLWPRLAQQGSPTARTGGVTVPQSHRARHSPSDQVNFSPQPPTTKMFSEPEMILGQCFMSFSHPGIFFAMLSRMMHLNGCLCLSLLWLVQTGRCAGEEGGLCHTSIGEYCFETCCSPSPASLQLPDLRAPLPHLG